VKRRSKAYYRKLGKLGAGIAKVYADPERARAQRRIAGIASGKARLGLKRGPYRKREYYATPKKELNENQTDVV
jgi:hypothetical protein